MSEEEIIHPEEFEVRIGWIDRKSEVIRGVTGYSLENDIYFLSFAPSEISSQARPFKTVWLKHPNIRWVEVTPVK